MQPILSGLYVIGLYGAYLAGFLHLGMQSAQTVNQQNPILRKVPYTTLLVTCLIAVPSSLQFFNPAMLSLLERNYARFLAGDWWRLITALFVQDGGIAGALFNLVSLVLVGTAAEQVWNSRSWLVIFFAGGILSQGVGFLWQPVGAGNSVANFSLAGSLVVACLGASKSPAVRILAFLAAGAGGILLVGKDIHGAAMFLGIGIALLMLRWNEK